MVASVGGPQQFGGPGQWPVWPVVKTALYSATQRNGILVTSLVFRDTVHSSCTSAHAANVSCVYRRTTLTLLYIIVALKSHIRYLNGGCKGRQPKSPMTRDFHYKSLYSTAHAHC